MNGDPRVIGALAVAILLLPAVANSIFVKAAGQADLEWLGDGNLDPDDFNEDDIDPNDFDPDDLPDDPPPVPPPGANQTKPPEPQCQITPRAIDEERVSPPSPFSGASQFGSVTVTVEEGDLAVLAYASGQNVTGNPRMTIRSDGEQRETWDPGPFFRERDVEPWGDKGAAFDPRDPGTEWTIEYDLTQSVHEGFVVAIATLQCVEGGE